MFDVHLIISIMSILKRKLLRVTNVSKAIIMQNEAGEFIDMYVPRKCSASNQIIHANDYSSIQLAVAEVDETTGRMTGTQKLYAICGKIRFMGEADDCINRLCKKDKIMSPTF